MLKWRPDALALHFSAYPGAKQGCRSQLGKEAGKDQGVSVLQQ